MSNVFDKIKQGEYTIRLNKRSIIVNIIRMDASLILWIGSPFNTSFSNLAVSVKTCSEMPSTANLLSKVDNNDISERLSRLLSKKFSQMVYVSCCLNFTEEEETILCSTLMSRIAEFL